MKRLTQSFHIKYFTHFLNIFTLFCVNFSISTPAATSCNTCCFGTGSTELKDSVPRTKDRGEHGYILRIPHLSRRSWQVVLRMSTTPSVLSCLHRMEVAMKQPVRPIPALRKTKKSRMGGGTEEEKTDGLAYWFALMPLIWLMWNPPWGNQTPEDWAMKKKKKIILSQQT